MKNSIKRMLLGFFCLILLTQAIAQGPSKKAVFIIVDGIPADVLEKVPKPHLDSLSRVGKYMRTYVGGGKGTYSETPTISAVSYNSLLTGTWVNKHNVWDNDIKAPNYHYPTIFQLFKKQYPAKKIAIFSSWQDNRTKLAGEGLAETGNIQFDYHFDGYELDTINFPHDKQRDFMHRIDKRVISDAVTCLKKQAPDLSWIYLEYTDDMGHMYGDSQQYYSAVEKMDKKIGQIAQAIQYRQKNHKEDWLFVITTDHGRDEKTGMHHGGQSSRQRSTWMVINQPGVNTYARYFKPGIVDIMPTMARFMNITIPPAVEWEIDGLPLTGSISLAAVEINYFRHTLDIAWKALEPKGNVKIWVATGNEFKIGGKDKYQLIAEVPLNQEHTVIDIKDLPSSFYKVVLEGPSNSVNKWILLEENK